MFFIILIMEIVAVAVICRHYEREAKNQFLAIIGYALAIIIFGGSLLWVAVGQRPDFPLLPFVLLAIANVAMAVCTSHRPSRHA